MEEGKRKKRFLLQTDFSLAKTGFAKCAKFLLSYLYSTGKYEILHVCCGTPTNAPQLEQTPWQSKGLVPTDPANQQRMQQDPNFARMASYGAALMDKYVEEFKPDAICCQQDFWGVDFNVDKAWFKKIPTIISTTLDSRPLLQTAVDKASKIPHLWMWSDFATKDMHKLGHTHVKTVHGPVDASQFSILPESTKRELRQKYNIPPDAFIINFTFRNQLRKLVDKLIEGYALWKKRNPEIKNTYLLLMTHFGEGWNIDSLAKQAGVNPKEILTVYVCRNCGEYEIKSYDDRKTPHEVDGQGRPKIDSNGKFIEKQIQLQDKDCRFCGAQKSQITTNVGLGITEDQLNEVYNVSDIYVHCMTSGGQEVPQMEASLCGLPSAMTNYSCGEDVCIPNGPALPLEYSTYLEIGTQFIKASTNPSSVAKQIDRLYRMGTTKRRELGVKAREWAIQNYDISVIGKIYEDFLDSVPLIDENDPKNFAAGEEKQWNPQAQLLPTNSDEEFIIELYHKVLDAQDVQRGHKDVDHWVTQIKNGMTKANVENTFRNIAAQELQKKQTTTLEDLLIKDDKKRVCYIMPESIGDIILSMGLFESIRERYPKDQYTFYVATKPEYQEVLEGCDLFDKWIPYNPQMDNLLAMEGQAGHKGFFDICYLPFVSTQRALTYLHNGEDKFDFELNK